MPFQRTFSGAPWEKTVGYCRAVRAGNLITVSGTAPVADDGSVVAPATATSPGDGYLQARRCLQIIARAIGSLDGDMAHVVRTRMFVTDISRWQEFGRAHGEAFASHPPATTMVQVSALIDPTLLIEIEADAIIDSV